MMDKVDKVAHASVTHCLSRRPPGEFKQKTRRARLPALLNMLPLPAAFSQFHATGEAPHVNVAALLATGCLLIVVAAVRMAFARAGGSTCTFDGVFAAAGSATWLHVRRSWRHHHGNAIAHGHDLKQVRVTEFFWLFPSSADLPAWHSSNS